jgi:hypothetical protein
LAPATAAALVGVGIQGLGLASKLFARDYHASGREVTVDDLGFDLEVAHYLTMKRRADEVVRVEVDRFMPTIASSIMDAVRNLFLASEQRLIPAVAAAAGALADATAKAEATEAEIAALDAQILELTKRVPDKTEADKSGVMTLLSELTERRRTLAGDLPELETALADARAKYERGTALLKDIDEFLTVALTPGPNGARPLVLQAGRVQGLVARDEQDPGGENPARDKEGAALYLLYVRLIAGGIDQVIEAKMGPDYFRALAGASAEFALFGGNGTLLTSGVRSVLQSSSMKLNDPKSFSQDRPNYVGLDRRRTS